MECKTQTAETESVEHGLNARARLRLAMALLRRQREILAMMMAERARRLEAAEPDQRREVAAVWSRAVQRQALMVKRMAAEVEQLNAAAQLPVRDHPGGYAA